MAGITWEPYARAWSALPTLYRVGAAAVVLVVVLALTGGVASLVSRWKDARFDAAERERAEERAELQKTRDAAIEQALAAEARAAVLEEQAEALKQVAANAALSAREQVRRAEEIERATEDAVNRAGTDPATARDEYRATLRRLGYR